MPNIARRRAEPGASGSPWQRCVCLCAGLLLVTAARGQIVLEWDFDHGSLDASGTVVTDTLVTLKPRTDIYVNRWIYVKATGIAGLNPTFRISDAYVAGNTLGDAHRYVYSYDQVNWVFFDHGNNDGSFYSFWNDAPFAQEPVWLAYALPYPLSKTEAHTQAVEASPWVRPTPSADASFVVGLSNDGTLTDLGRPVPRHNIYGYLITDDAAPGPKSVIMLTTGNHPNETTGTYTFQGLVDFVLSDDARAAALRRVADFYVYPTCNPDGRWAGHARSNPENPNIDHNRDWDDPVLFTDLTVLTAAMQFDTGSQVDYFFDFHAFNNTSDIAIWVYPDQTNIPFVQALVTREPTMQLMLGSSPPDSPGVSRHWAHSAAGLNAPYTFTPESGFIPGWQPERYLLQGKNYALALYDALVVGPCANADTAGVAVYADDFDAGTSGLLWNLYTTSSDYTADFGYDYGAEGIPSAPNSAGGSTIGVKFTVNNNDALTGAEAVSAYPSGQSFSGDYELTCDLWLNYNGGAGGGTGSTEFAALGVGAAGTQVNWPNNPASDGYTFTVTGEGGATQDYRAYGGASMYDVASGVYAAGSQNHTDAYYQALFPSPEYETVGAPGKHWVEATVTYRANRIDWRLNGTLIASVTNATGSPGNIILGYQDVFASLAIPAADNFILYDNVRVEQLPNTDCNGNALPDACEVIAPGDYNADGLVDLGDWPALAVCLGGPGAAPMAAGCEAYCLTVFDFNDDADVDLRDFAAFAGLVP